VTKHGSESTITGTQLKSNLFNRGLANIDKHRNPPCTWWIKASIQEYILRSWPLVKMGTAAKQKKLFFHLREGRHRLRHRNPARTALSHVD
jgi:hypothetical protein